MVDARSSARFKGEVAEPRPSLPSGGMKGALNLHYSNLLDPEQGTVKPKTELAKGDPLYMYVHVGYVHNNNYHDGWVVCTRPTTYSKNYH